jgi:NAD(P)-dependent dehydrogenase (short-subunit alcohol dehydrogenase family)
MRLNGKTAIIAGAGGGMGRAAALLFADRGARLLLTDKNEESGIATQRLLAGKGHQPLFVPGNVGRRADVQALVQAAVDAYGRIDVLFNNAGSDEGSGDLLSVSEDPIEACIASNLKSAIPRCQAALPVMIAGGGGSIVSTASTTGMRGQNGLGVYGAAKAGVINFMRYIALEYGPQGIRANSICPGVINTPLLRGHERSRCPACGAVLAAPGSPTPDRRPRRHRGDRPLPRVRRVGVHHRAGDPCRRRHDLRHLHRSRPHHQPRARRARPDHHLGGMKGASARPR